MREKRPDLRDIKLHGGEVLRGLEPHIRRLHEVLAHGNRTLYDDQLFVALLLSFYNPIVRSLRLIEDCGNMNGRLDLNKLAKSTTSDALAVFDPDRLKPIIQDLQARVPAPRRGDDSLVGITQRIMAADGTYLTTFADVAWALVHTKTDGRKQAQVRLNTQIDTHSWVPQVVSISGDDGESEPGAFTRDLLHDVLYVFDRNFLDFAFLKAVLKKSNHFVLRVRDRVPLTRTVRERPVSEEDRQAGVVLDHVVTLPGRGAPGGEFRLVEIHTINRRGKPEILRLLSSLHETTGDEIVPAHVIGTVYKKRWQIELFFKWLKCWAGFDHLFSTTRQGITTQFYVAVIAILLIQVEMGRRVSRYALLQLHLLSQGQTTLEQAMAVLDKREHERSMAQAAKARRAAKKQLA